MSICIIILIGGNIMICSKQFENALIEYKNLGKDDINVYKDNIIVVLDDLNFSLDKLKYSLIKYLTKEGLNVSIQKNI